MDRTAQALEIAKCLDALPCKWDCVTTFNRTIDDRDYLFNLFSRDASIEVIAAFPLEFSESRRRYYESMAEDFTARRNRPLLRRRRPAAPEREHAAARRGRRCARRGRGLSAPAVLLAH